MKTAISIPDPLFREAERLARRMGLSRSEVFQRAVAGFVRAHGDAEITEALNRVYAEDPKAGRLDPVLERLQFEALPDEDWR